MTDKSTLHSTVAFIVHHFSRCRILSSQPICLKTNRNLIQQHFRCSLSRKTSQLSCYSSTAQTQRVNRSPPLETVPTVHQRLRDLTQKGKLVLQPYRSEQPSSRIRVAPVIVKMIGIRECSKFEGCQCDQKDVNPRGLTQKALKTRNSFWLSCCSMRVSSWMLPCKQRSSFTDLSCLQISLKTHAAKILRALEDLYAWLPLATIIDGKVFVVHGGVSNKTNLKDIAAIDRHKFLTVLRPPVSEGQLAYEPVEWKQKGTTDRRGRSHPPQCTTSREDRQIVRVAVTDRSVTSRTIAQHIESVTHHSVPVRTIRLQQSGLSARRPLLGLTLTQNHRRLRHQWCDERRMWVAEWNEVVFTDESRICLKHYDGRIQVWRHRGESMLNSCVMHRHNGPAPGIMVWGGIEYHSGTPLVRIAGIFQQDNAQPHVARIVQRFFVNHQIELLHWMACSPDLSPIENMWSMVTQRLTQITPRAATPDQLWQRVEAAWSAVPQEHIQSLFE
ncbi:transposable element Tcb1 transposase [Trichonephila clavipes]|uniref:Transposable element Tcb1 transposase n=1 Tax=Trichonephila clavipes TaxID=2585209 RepID=A0A8X6VTB1_TRICX|nr:transposable element Tcb1 transposase [Trichonephila clavipes]